ncbi:MAG: ABC transporter substrate-binding protein [Aliarcobacter sp.]|nr:ABC transporter substrate-binding protein [Aliarcobacter sp.]
MKKILLILISISILLSANTNKKITLQLNWLNQFQFAGYYIAKEKGFYNEVGIDIDIKEITSNINLVEMIETKKADFAVGSSSLLIDKINGSDVIALGSIFQESPLMLLLRKDSNINSVKELKNKKIMITDNAVNSASILAMLSANGLRETDFIRQKHSFNIEDLINGNTDAMASYMSNEPILLKDRNIEYKIFHPKDFGFDFYNDILFTSSEFIKNNPKLTKDFYDATIKGWKYAFENIGETAEIIFNKYNTQNKLLIHLIKEGEILKKMAYANDEDIGHIDEGKLENTVNIFKLAGLVNSDMDINAFIYDENPHKTMTFELTHQEEKLIFLIMAFLFFAFLLIIYFLTKNHQIKGLLRTVINTTDDLIFFKDCKLRYLGCNRNFERFIGKKESEIIGKNDFELFEKEYAQHFRENDLSVIKAKRILINEEWVIFEDKKILLQTKMIPLQYKKNDKQGVLGISRDITELHEIHEKLKEQAYHDELTNIFNRKAFNERIKEKFDLYQRYNSIFCIAMYDIDNFKNINDTYGHDIGDKVLREMTEEIKLNIRKTDLLFRIGGEEFIIIFSKTLIDEAFEVAEKIRTSVSNMNIIDNERITISIGLSQVKEDDDADSIYERIDKLMYESKHNGKNQTSKD